MKKPFLKIISLLLIIGLNWSVISLIAGTDAYFNDVEMSEGNSMTAGVLDFELEGDGFHANEGPPYQYRFGRQYWTLDESIKVINDEDNLEFKYSVAVEITDEDNDFCDNLYLTAYLNDSVDTVYNDLLEDFNLSDHEVPPFNNPDEWDFEITSQDPSVKGICEFDFVFQAYQENLNYGEGFFDEERIDNVISNSNQPPVLSSCIKINEVYYNIDASHVDASHGNDPNDEWIELYNSCEYEVNLKDWYLEDNQGESYREVIHSTYPIKVGQFVVIAANASIWSYWPNIPDNAFKIAIGDTRLFNGLSNSGDVVILYDKDGNQIDEVSWGNNTTGLNPAVPGVDEGHSISRIEKGVDTNSANDWFDTHSISLPSPGPNPGTNPHSEDGTLLLSPPPPAMNSTPAPTIPEPIIEPTTDDEEDAAADDIASDDDTDKGDDTDTDDTADETTTATDDADDSDDTDDTDDDTTDGDADVGDTDTSDEDTDDTGDGDIDDGDSTDDTTDGDADTGDVDADIGDEETGEDMKPEVDDGAVNGNPEEQNSDNENSFGV